MELRETRSRKMFAIFAVLMAALIALALCLSFGVNKAYAGGESLDTLKGSKSGAVYIAKKDIGTHVYWAISNPKKSITNVKSSNTKVATVNASKSSYDKTWALIVNCKKAGTTTISYKHAGKTYKVKYTVAKYTNPFKALKIGSTNYASKFAPSKLKSISSNSTSAVTAKSSVSGKINVTPAKGWKIVDLYASVNGEYKQVKNKATVKRATMLQVTMQNKTTGVCLRTILGFYKNA